MAKKELPEEAEAKRGLASAESGKGKGGAVRRRVGPEGVGVDAMEKVNHPAHYGGDVPHEVVKCLEAWGLESDALLWNAVKYISRAGKKNSALEDLKKGCVVSRTADRDARGRSIMSWPNYAAAIKICPVVILAGLVGYAEFHATQRRNQIWGTDKSLWEDAILKSPGDGRAWMNAGLWYMEHAKYDRALAYFYMADEAWPGYSIVKINLAIAHGQLGHNDTAEAYFREAITLRAGEPLGHFYFARWLEQKGRASEASVELQAAIRLTPNRPASYDELEKKLETR